MNGQASEAAPMTAALPVNNFIKSRLVGSAGMAEDIPLWTAALAVSAILSLNPLPSPQQAGDP
jgi:hypothetical protein